MTKISGLRSIWRFRSLFRSTSHESFANPKITAEKLIKKQGPVRPDVETMNPMISGILRPQISYILKANWPFSKRLFHGTQPLTFGRKNKFQQSVDLKKVPGNTVRIVLNPDDLTASKHSFSKGIRKARSWLRSRSNPTDLSSYFGPGAEVFTTPEDGWEVDKLKIFEIRGRNVKSEFIQDSRCIPIEMGVNYSYICKGLEFVRVGFHAMIDNFEVLHKSSSLSSDLIEAVAVFAVNVAEAIRFNWVLEDILEAFDINLELDSKRTLSCYVRKYAHYSYEYLSYVHHLQKGLPTPDITNRSGGTIRDIYELRSLINIPLRTALKKIPKKADKDKAPKKEEFKVPIWSPPYPDGVDWLLNEEQQDQMEEKLLKEEEQEQREGQLTKEEEQEQIEEQKGSQLEGQQKMEDHNISGSIIRCLSFVNAGAPGVQISIPPSGYSSWPRITKFLRWFIR